MTSNTAKILRPMKAVALTANKIAQLKFPVLVSPKIDGIRCIVHPTLGPITQSGNAVPNNHIRNTLMYDCGHLFRGFMPDGELVCVTGVDMLDYQPLHKIACEYNDTQSGVMSEAGNPTFKYCIFDCIPFEYTATYATRYKEIMRLFADVNPYIDVVAHVMIDNAEELIAYYERVLELGYEGVMIRSLDGPYKHGRSTAKEGYLLKLKPWEDTEGIVVAFAEEMYNSNEAELDNFDHTKRSSSKEGMVGKGILGAFIVQTQQWGLVRVGGGDGLTKARRKEIWDNREKYIDQVVTFKYMSIGMKDKPRFPKFKGFRYD